MPKTRSVARTPEDVSRLFVEYANARDAEGMTELYEPDAVVAYPPGQITTGRAAILELYKKFVANAPQMKVEEPLTTLQCGDLALTSTRPTDNAGARAQVVRRQPDGRWLRVLDRPEFR